MLRMFALGNNSVSCSGLVSCGGSKDKLAQSDARQALVRHIIGALALSSIAVVQQQDPEIQQDYVWSGLSLLF